ncbi:hypothetical protein M0R45_016318 [Rubus argutus]|uniref:Uncharacterized protein n=1 Tax=Rubus argutus TaxID=59490 RepID=A0AAW1XUP0_RUBAR
MRSALSLNLTKTQQKQATPLFFRALIKCLAISCLTFVLFYMWFLDKSNNYQPSNLLETIKQNFPASTTCPVSHSPTNLSHIVIGMVGSINTLKQKTSIHQSMVAALMSLEDTSF